MQEQCKKIQPIIYGAIIVSSSHNKYMCGSAKVKERVRKKNIFITKLY